MYKVLTFTERESQGLEVRGGAPGPKIPELGLGAPVELFEHTAVGGRLGQLLYGQVQLQEKQTFLKLFTHHFIDLDLVLWWPSHQQ